MYSASSWSELILDQENKKTRIMNQAVKLYMLNPRYRHSALCPFGIVSVRHCVRSASWLRLIVFRQKCIRHPVRARICTIARVIYIPDHLRVAFTRLRLMSHSLKIESGRWSRTPAEFRLCHCDEGKVQDEPHVLLECPLTNGCREAFPSLDFSSVYNLLNENVNCDMLCKYIFNVLHESCTL